MPDTDVTRKAKATKLLLQGLLLGACYVAARYVVYVYVWSDGLEGAGLGRQLILTPARLVALAAVLWVLRPSSNKILLGTHLHGMKSAAIATAIFLSASALDLVGYGFTYWPGMKLWLTFCFINIFVSLFEEFLFRGLLLNSLVDLFAARTAVLISAALFAAYHFGVTPPQAWPGHVAFGLVMGFARLSGTSVIWLSVGHWILDCFTDSYRVTVGYSWQHWCELSIVLAGAAAYWWRSPASAKIKTHVL